MNKMLSIRRKEKDIFKLRNAKIKVQAGEKDSHYQIQFEGPAETPYQSGVWSINLYLPEEYPYKSPSVGFVNKIFHPNIDYSSGSVCLDVINQTWTPMYELVNIFEIFLPQLLTYPNPASPLNHEAATLFEQDVEKYNKKVIDIIQKHSLNQKFKKKIEKLQEPSKQEVPLTQYQIVEQKDEINLDQQQQNNQMLQQSQQDMEFEDQSSNNDDSCSLSQRQFEGNENGKSQAYQDDLQLY